MAIRMFVVIRTRGTARMSAPIVRTRKRPKAASPFQTVVFALAMSILGTQARVCQRLLRPVIMGITVIFERTFDDPFPARVPHLHWTSPHHRPPPRAGGVPLGPRPDSQDAPPLPDRGGA